jgi:glycosyltransferase involved in cell wall biosynthesis
VSWPGKSVRDIFWPRRLLEVCWDSHVAPIEWLIGRVDVVHALDHIAPWTRGHSVVTIHDVTWRTCPEYMEPRVARYFERRVTRTLRRVDEVIVPSLFTKAEVLRHFCLPEEIVHVVHEAPADAYRRVEDTAVLRSATLRYALHRPFLLYVGTLERRKNLEFLAAAFDRLGLGDAAELILVGSGHEYYVNELDRYLGTLTSSSVRRVGHVPHADLPSLYTLCSGFVYVSHYEGFGLPPLEAMACGAPTIVSDRGALREVVGDAAAVVGADDEAALAEVMEDLVRGSKASAELSRRGPTRAATFAWATAARLTLDVYRRAGCSN